MYISVKHKLIYVSAGAVVGATVSALALIHKPGTNLLAFGGITLGAVTLFDWLLILSLPQIRSNKQLRRIFVLFILPAPFIALGAVALSYQRTFYYGLISLIAGVILSRSLRKTIFEGIAELRSVIEREEAASH